MRRALFYISGILMITVSLSSCVSKKKFEELARAKRSSDREVVNLQNDKKRMEAEIVKMKNDFNAIRYQLTANIAAKDKQIDALYAKLRVLETKESALKSELKDVSDQVKYKEQNSNVQLETLENQIKTVKSERDQLKKIATRSKNKFGVG